MHKLAEQALEKVELAGIYLDDGAPRSAARLLREAADKLDKLAGERDTYAFHHGPPPSGMEIVGKLPNGGVLVRSTIEPTVKLDDEEQP